jgi:predicted MPP superfamily phosphohydrolase
LEMALDLERDGLPILLNETAEIRRGGDSLWIAGVDDPHYFQTHDLAGTRTKAPADAFVILLSHSPETYAEAAAQGFALQLSGHTHGGQICLPGGRHVVVPCKSPRRFIAGAWQHGSLQGYTSRGTGACGVAARWNCPPEITLHTLRRAKA